MNDIIFSLPHPILGQPWGRLANRYQDFDNGTATIVYKIGKLVNGEFVLAVHAKTIQRVFGPAELDKFYDFVEGLGQPPGIRGQFRDTDLGEWFAQGDGEVIP